MKRWLFIIAISLILGVTARPQQTATATGSVISGTSTSVLSGCRVSATNTPSCSIPAPWSLAIAEGFDSGVLGDSSGSEYALLNGGTTLATSTTVTHTGARSMVCNISFDGAACALGILPQTFTTGSNHTYVSYWRRMDSNACGQVEIYFADWYTGDRTGFFDVLDTQGPPGSPCLTNMGISMFGDGTAVFQYPQNASWNLPISVWEQVEAEFKGSTCTGSTSNNDGLFRLWINGAKLVDQTNQNLNGCAGAFSSVGMGIEAGSLFTFENSSGASSTPQNGAFNQYLDDVILLKQ